jgi:hypothetical protein
MGDRFGHQAEAQLTALILAAEKGVRITPVWNKSYREHNIIGSQPADVRLAAQNAVKNLNWRDGYFVDADHINLKTVGGFIDSSDFFTLDVADAIGHPAREEIRAFMKFAEKYTRHSTFRHTQKIGVDGRCRKNRPPISGGGSLGQSNL